MADGPRPSTSNDMRSPAEPIVRRPMNAFLIFCKRHRGMVKEKNPNMDNRNITKVLGEWWSMLDKDEKSKYVDLAKQYKEAFLRANPGFRWHNERASGPSSPGSAKPDSDISPNKSSDHSSYEEHSDQSDCSPDSKLGTAMSVHHTPPSNAALLELAMMCTNELYHDKISPLPSVPHNQPVPGSSPPPPIRKPPDKTKLHETPTTTVKSEELKSELKQEDTAQHTSDMNTGLDVTDGEIMPDQLSNEPLKCEEKMSLVEARANEREKETLQSDVSNSAQEETADLSALSVDSNCSIHEEDVYEEAPRKSMRSNRGKRYQELIQQGIIRHKPDKKRSKNGDSLSRSHGEVMLDELHETRRRHQSEPVQQPTKFNSSDFDLEAHIAELPACNIDMPNKHKPKHTRKRNHDSCSSASSDLLSAELLSSPLGTSYDEKMEVTEEVTGSRKRKMRRRTITHLVPQSPTSTIKVPAQWLKDQNENSPKSTNQNAPEIFVEWPTNEEPEEFTVQTTSKDVECSVIESNETTPSKSSNYDCGPPKPRDRDSDSDSEGLIIDEGPKTPPGRNLIRKLEFQGKEFATLGYVDTLPTCAQKESPHATYLRNKREKGAASARIFRPSLHIDVGRPRSAGSDLPSRREILQQDLERVKVDLRSRWSPQRPLMGAREFGDELKTLRCTEQVSNVMKGVAVRAFTNRHIP